MEKELQLQLSSIIEGAKEAGISAYEFLQTQAPELATEIIRWGIYSNGVAIAISVLVFLGTFVILFFLIHKKKTDENWAWLWSDDCQFGIVSCILSTAAVIVVPFVSLLVFSQHIGPFIKAVIAPRLYILEYLGALI